MLVRELTSVEANDPIRRRLVDFWNVAHVMEHRSDVQLGIWTRKPPKLPPLFYPVSAPLAVFGWPTKSRFGMLTLPLAMVERNPSLLGTGASDDVVMARRSLPPTVMAELEKRFAYRPHLTGQETGWWYLDNKVVPKHQPTRHESVALLPEPRKTVGSRFDALVLIEIDDYWRVLSERALLVYTIGAALDERRPVQFAQWKNRRRVVWDVEKAVSIPLKDVSTRFGADAAERAVPDAQSIVVSCTRRP